MVRAPTPVSVWLTVKVFAASAMSKLPPAGSQLIARDVLLKLVPVIWSVPPLKESGPASPPRFASCDTDTMPPVKVVPPV